MFDQPKLIAPIVFLHIPKTAGQTIHNELARAVGKHSVSPIRVHSQAKEEQTQFPPGYQLYSGHLDWLELDQIAKPRFVFSILRDPKERIASFYFYLLKEAKKLSESDLNKPEHIGKRIILERNADDYFFGGDDAWRAFILDHFDNVYCRYFGSQKIRAGQSFSSLRDRRKLRSAFNNLGKIDWIYSIDNLGALEADLAELYGFDLNFSEARTNVGDRPVHEKRWPSLLSNFERDASSTQIERFVKLDSQLMQQLEL
jgi:hypothetical protein